MPAIDHHESRITNDRLRFGLYETHVRVPVPALSPANPTHLPALHDPRYSFFAMLSRSSEPCLTRLRIGTLADGCRWLSRGLAPTSCSEQTNGKPAQKLGGGTFQTPAAKKKERKKSGSRRTAFFCPFALPLPSAHPTKPTSLVRFRPALAAFGRACVLQEVPLCTQHACAYLGVPCRTESTYLVPLFRRRRRRLLLHVLCDLVMVYTTIDDLVLDHLSGYHIGCILLPLA
jgi:hypothetical protein